MNEITKAMIKLEAGGKSVDCDGLHSAKMLKQGTIFFIALHVLCKKVLRTHKWFWRSSNLIIFGKKWAKRTTPMQEHTGQYVFARKLAKLERIFLKVDCGC